MNILLINHYAGSIYHGMEYRPFYLAREWVKMGHQVTIVASAFSHLRSKTPQVSKEFSEEIIDGIRYIWIRTPTYHGNGIRRVVNMFSFVKKLFYYKRELIRKCKPEYVIASSTYPMDIYPACSIAKESRAKLIFEVHDLWPLTPMELGGMSRWHPFIYFMQKAENFAYKSAFRVISMLPKAYDHMCEHGMEPFKFSYIPNGIDISEWESNQDNILPHEHKTLLSNLKGKKNFLVGYAGSHGLANALDTLIESALILRNEPVKFILVGQGAEKERLFRKTNELGLTNIFFLSTIPKNLIPSFLSEMDALYIGWKKEPLYRFGINPNKLMDYMMSSKPVIHSIEAGNDIVAESGCGISVKPEDPVAISDGIKKIMEMDEGQRAIIGHLGRKYVTSHHDYRILAKQFIEAISK